MRLWHQDLISSLPAQQLLGQHRKICALRGLSWNKPHSVVNYVFTYPYYYLFIFHELVIVEMEKRGYQVEPLWKNYQYRGKRIGFDDSDFTKKYIVSNTYIYLEHNDEYLLECLDNLKGKGIILDWDNSPTQN